MKKLLPWRERGKENKKLRWLFPMKTACSCIVWAKLTLFFKDKLKISLLVQCQLQNHRMVKNYPILYQFFNNE